MHVMKELDANPSHTHTRKPPLPPHTHTLTVKLQGVRGREAKTVQFSVLTLNTLKKAERIECNVQKKI